MRVIYSDNTKEATGLVIAPRRMRIKDAVAIEDITKTPTWLHLNAIVTEGTALTFVHSSSYYKVTSEKARRLAWLAEASRNVRLVDVTPFCESIEYLYMTWRYIDRTILGYQHHYAFAGGHAERHGDKIVSSLDDDLNVSKISPHCRIEKTPIRQARQHVTCRYTVSEHSAYRKLRNHLFETKKTPQPIVTALADLVHSFETRRNAVLECATDDSVIVTNLTTYADYYRQNGLRAGTYVKPPDVSNANRVIFAEPPIVYTYRRLHIEMAMLDSAEVIDVRGDAKVDTYLGDRIDTETRNIGRFCEKLLEAQK